MFNKRRLPGLLYKCRYIFTAIISLGLILTYILIQWGIVCFNSDSIKYISDACHEYERGVAVGELCHSLCNEEIPPESVSCHSFHMGKEAVFSANLKNYRVIFKVAHTHKEEIESLYWLDHNNKKHYPSENEFDKMIRDVVSYKLNLSITREQVKKLGTLRYGYIEADNNKRRMDMQNVWPLIQDNEYLSAKIYSEREIFPQLTGTCGKLFSMEYLEPVGISNGLTLTDDSKVEWGNRLKLAVQIIDYLEELDIDFPEPFSLCDVKLAHFGYAKGKQRLKYLDLDSVYPRSVINQMTSDGTTCSEDSHCDYFDCRSRCNKDINRCNNPVTNNNLQVVCEKIFLGWTMSNTFIVSGLLVTSHTPSSLTVLLRQCANPHNEELTPRAATSEYVKKRLYNILIEMEQEVNNDYE